MSTHSPKPPPHVSPRGMWISKLILRSIELASSIATIGVVTNMMSNDLVTTTTVGITACSTIPGIIWTIADTACIIFRRGRRGIHPGANIALDLILWIVFIGLIIFFSLVSVGIRAQLEKVESAYAASTTRIPSSSYGSDYRTGAGYPSSTSANAYAGSRAGSGYMGASSPCNGATGGTSYGSLCLSRRQAQAADYEFAISIFQQVLGGINLVFGLGAILVILHLASFVIACVETHKRRMKRHQISCVLHNAQNDAEQVFKLGGYQKMQNQSSVSVQSQFTGYSPAEWKALEAGAHPSPPVPAAVPACLVPGQGQSPVYKHQAQFKLPTPTQGYSPVKSYQTQFQAPTPNVGSQGYSPVKTQPTTQLHNQSPVQEQSQMHTQQAYLASPTPTQADKVYLALPPPPQNQQPLPWQRPQGAYGLPESPAPTYQKVQSHVNKTRYEVMAELT